MDPDILVNFVYAVSEMVIRLWDPFVWDLMVSILVGKLKIVWVAREDVAI